MPTILDTPPDHVQAEIAELRADLDQNIPRKELDRNVLIATWNIREFGGLTEEWNGDEHTPKRDLHSLLLIAEIIKRFDIVAIQEVTGKLKSLRHLLKVLGEHWSFILTDVSKGSSGNDERLAYLFDTRKVKLSGLACELVTPNEDVENIEEGAFSRQFARTPYAVSFRSCSKTFILVTAHILYGKRAEEREPELAAIAEWLKKWSTDMNAFDQSLILLGDFNIDRAGDPRYDAFVSTGLYLPDDLSDVRRMIYDKSTKYYDQLAWFKDENGEDKISLEFARGGTYDFTRIALNSRDYTNNSLSWRMSDHLPLWGEFLV
ncbi:MAG: endonuclease/exonuclease/phosphatase family protein [Cryomorphaceae bacterium]